ncbi:MAG: DUF6084 family protein [Acidimicrobiales bacterium]
MTELRFSVLGARPEPYAAEPTLMFRLAAEELAGKTVHTVALRCQLRIEPQRRRYAPDEEERLLDLFGETPRWGDSLRPFLWTHASAMLPGFTDRTEVDLPVTCTYDFDVAAAKYLHSLGDGDVPLLLLFSGTVFFKGGAGLNAEPVPWHTEASYRLPASVWREVMDLYFPNSGWLRLQCDTLDRLQRYKSTRALPTWEQAIESLLKEAGAGDS